MDKQVTIPSRRRILDDAAAGLGSVRGPHISLRGGRFRFVTAAGDRFVETHHLDIIVVDANKFDARVYFEGQFDPSNMEVPPLCFSDNGTGPSRDSIQPQAPTCGQCQWNVRGSDVTFTGKATTACTRRKKLGVIEPDSPDMTVYEFAIPPGSLSNFKAYTTWLNQQNHPTENRPCDICDVVTRVEFDPDKPFVMKFTCSAWADDAATLAKVEKIFVEDLGAVATGRHDVAIDPQSFGALPRPVQVQSEHFTALRAPSAAVAQLPPRQPQTLPPPTKEAPRGRGRPRKEETPPAAASPATAPFMAPAAPPATTQKDSAMDIPAFLKRVPDTPPPAPAAPPRFGVGQAPPPPAEIQNAVNQAMSLPSRK